MTLTAFDTSTFPDALPDVTTNDLACVERELDRVGMEQIDLQILVRNSRDQLQFLPAQADAFVSLDSPKAKGIHMSRMFLAVQEILGSNELNFETVDLVLRSFLTSHKELSQSSYLEVRFEYLIERPSLISANTGWKSYPVKIKASRVGDRFFHEMGFTVAYSSTCPCSASLARQLIEQDFRETFGSRDMINSEDVIAWLGMERSLHATPHSQRSFAEVDLVLSPDYHELPLRSFIDAVEEVLGTAVQAVVKRVDEQAFSRLNGKNLMFCEDAARRISAMLDKYLDVLDYRVKAEHHESLHAHNAASIVTKRKFIRVDGSYSA